MSSFLSQDVIKKISPFSNPDIVWFFLFLPTLILYFYRLHSYVNDKPSIGSIEVIDPSFYKLLYNGYDMEIIATNLSWSEGPLWVETDSVGYLVFSDTVTNRLYRWEQGKGFFTVGKTLFMRNTGCYSNSSYCEEIVEPGSNGLLRIPNDPLLNDPSRLDMIACQHGERAVGVLLANGTRFSLASRFKGRRFNSPNDLVWSPDGHIYFTDPRYGLLLKSNEFISPEIPVAGIYVIYKDDIKASLTSGVPTKNVNIVAKDLSWPNGLAFSPDFSKLYVSNSDSKNSFIKVYDVNDDGSLGKGSVFFNASSLPNETYLDGMKIDIHGNVFVAGSGGVLVINADGKLIGKLRLDRKASNLIFGGDGRMYITASDIVVRMWIKTTPNRIIKMKW